uniref:Reverse transcriptase domain-containing protein n=1 Tax=Takifugu rubripes TaxID=31033 RepID=A0A674NX77_TAKRU
MGTGVPSGVQLRRLPRQRLGHGKSSSLVRIAGIKSNSFPVRVGLRQGCPLSPILPALFVLSLEPLAKAIRQSNLILPISVCNTQHQLSLYADDVLVFLENPAQSTPHLLAAKSSVLPINIPIVPHFTYLGIEIFPSLNQITKYNYSVVLNKTLRDLDRWVDLPMSIRACVSVIKMNILPRINFVSSMIPLPPPSDHWSKLQSATTKFIWNKKRPRLKMSVLQRRREDGGLAVPDFKLYFWSFVLRPLLSWFNPDCSCNSLHLCQYVIFFCPVFLSLYTYFILFFKSLWCLHCILSYGMFLALGLFLLYCIFCLYLKIKKLIIEKKNATSFLVCALSA